jgi:hypothetical protein
VAIERFPIEAGHILLFARAIGDTNPAYEGDAPFAPPTFVQASAQFDPDYPLRPKPGKAWFGSGREPTGARRDAGTTASAGKSDGGGGTGLHAEQHFEYHRPLRAGMVLHAGPYKPGKTWEKQGRRAGKLVFNEMITEFFDEHGELVVTARSVGVRTERVVEQDGA